MGIIPSTESSLYLISIYIYTMPYYKQSSQIDEQAKMTTACESTSKILQLVA